MSARATTLRSTPMSTVRCGPQAGAAVAVAENPTLEMANATAITDIIDTCLARMRPTIPRDGSA